MKTLSGIRAVGAAMVLGGVAATATAAWQPGLWGGFHTRGASDFASPPIYTNVFSDTHCATNWNGGTSNTDSPDIIWSNNRVWSYWGQIYLPAANVTFGQAIDDKAILYIDGLKILNQVAANCVRTTVTTNYTTAGWHDFMFQASNGAGGAGPMSSGNGLGDGIGFGVKFGDDTAWSYMADDGNMSRYRHDDGLGFDDTFRVTGVPSNFGAPVPFYGTYAGVANGSNLTMSVASGSGYVTASDTQRACCTGYVWYAVDSVSSTKTVVQGGADTSFAYSHNNMAEIAWHWKVENLVTVTAGTGGSVSTNGGWLDAGATIEVTAIDGDGFFLCWLGDIDEAQRTSRTITITADQARTVTAHFGNEIFVATNGNDTASGTSADPVATLAAALSLCGDDGIVTFTPGIYTISSETTLATGVTVRGETDNPDDVILKCNGKYRHFKLAHADARLSGLTLTDGKPAAGHGGTVLITQAGGMVSNCVMRNSAPEAWGTEGGGFYIEKNAATALVTDCIVSNCCCSTAGNGFDNAYGGGIAAYMAAGTVRNCLFVKNGTTALCSNKGGAVHITGGTLANCTVTGTFYQSGTGVRADGGTVINCLIGANDTGSDRSGHDAIWIGNANCFTNCLAESAINEWCSGAIRLFANVAAGDYRPAAAAVDAGVPLDWMDGAADLAGNARIIGTAPDIGCHERDQSLFDVSTAPSALAGFAPLTVDFEVTTWGVGAAGITCQWDWDGDGVYDETTTGSTSHTFTTCGDFPVSVKVTDVATDTVREDHGIGTIRVRPRVLYVDAQSADPVAPYGDAAHAARNVADALDIAISGSSVEIAEGTYDIPVQLELTEGVVVRGATGNPEDVILKMKGSNHRIAFLDHAEARIENVAMQGGNIANNTSIYTKNGGGVFIGAQGGTLSNCIVRACRTWVWGNEGDGIYIQSGATAALVTHCVITNCQNATAQNQDNLGAALYMCAGTVRNSLFAYNNPPKANTTDPIWTAYAEGGSIENCTFTANDSPRASGVYASQNADIVNCLVVGNTTALDSATHPDYIGCGGTAASYFRCLSETAVNADCFAAPAGAVFKDFEAGDFRLHRLSPAVSRGTPLAWATSTATDLAGKPRLSGRLDLGAYECHGAGVMIIVR